jgi:hypothetical protein
MLNKIVTGDLKSKIPCIKQKMTLRINSRSFLLNITLPYKCHCEAICAEAISRLQLKRRLPRRQKPRAAARNDINL